MKRFVAPTPKYKDAEEARIASLFTNRCTHPKSEQHSFTEQIGHFGPRYYVTKCLECGAVLSRGKVG